MEVDDVVKTEEQQDVVKVEEPTEDATATNEEAPPRLDRFGRPMKPRKEPPEDVKMRSRILKICEHYMEDDNTSITITAGEINEGVKTMLELILETLPKAISRMSHKSFIYGALMTKIDPLLAKTVMDDIIRSEMPAAFKRADKMACKA